MEDASIIIHKRSIICDASILIDYILSNRNILFSASKYIGQLIVPGPIFDEVNQLDYETAEQLGLRIIAPELHQIKEASDRGGSLSRSDKLTFVMARDAECFCCTSDLNMRKLCLDHNVKVLWGLELMIMLCEIGRLSKAKAIRIVEKIKLNGAFITDEVIEDFKAKIEDI